MIPHIMPLTTTTAIPDRNHQLLYFNKKLCQPWISRHHNVYISAREKESYPLPSNSSCNSTVGMAYPRQSPGDLMDIV